MIKGGVMTDTNQDDLFQEKLLISCVHQARQTEKVNFLFDDILTVPLVYQMNFKKTIKAHRQYARENPNHFKEIMFDILETADFKHKKSIKSFHQCYGNIKKTASHCNPKDILLCGLAKSEFKDFLYAIGVWDKTALNRYNLCEQNFIAAKKRMVEKQVAAILGKFYANECQLLMQNGMNMPQITAIEKPSFDCVVDYAQDRGIMLVPSEDIIDLAKETYRYLNLYAHALFPRKNNESFFYDGTPDTVQWAKMCRPYQELEETVLYHSVKIFGEDWKIINETGAFAGSMLLQARIADNLAKLSALGCGDDDVSAETFRKMILPMDALSYLSQHYPQSEQTKRNLLVHTVMGTMQYLERYHDEEWRPVLCDWYLKCTQGLKERLNEMSVQMQETVQKVSDEEEYEEINTEPQIIEKATCQKRTRSKNKKSGKERE